MNCTICGTPVVLVPSAAERAARSQGGWTAADYTRVFTTHSDCALKQRSEDTNALMAKLRGKQC